MKIYNTDQQWHYTIATQASAKVIYVRTAVSYANTYWKNDQTETQKNVILYSDWHAVCGIMKTIDMKIWLVAWLVVRAVNLKQITTVVWAVASEVYASRTSSRKTC